MSRMDTEKLQKGHYDRISIEYAAHYGDESSRKYRDLFFYDPMFQDIDLAGKKVLEAMCGRGETTPFLTEKKAVVTGLDISSKEIEMFRNRWPACDAVCASIFDSGLPRESFDMVVVVGGLHHVQPHVERAVTEIHAVLKKGGVFCFVEPHKGSVPDCVRRWWYQRDNFFINNEEAVDVQALQQEFSGRFEPVHKAYRGNIAYLLVLNSMIFRIPLALKKFYAPVLLFFERMIQPLQCKSFSCYIAAQWRKSG